MGTGTQNGNPFTITSAEVSNANDTFTIKKEMSTGSEYCYLYMENYIQGTVDSLRMKGQCGVSPNIKSMICTLDNATMMIDTTNNVKIWLIADKEKIYGAGL